MSESPFILVVDDDLNMTRTLCDILEASAFPCITALNAHAGLESLQNNSCKVVLTDIRMDGMNGVELQKVINEKYPGTRVILMTAYADYELINRGRLQGALAFLDKPLNIPLLLSILRAVKEGAFRIATPPTVVPQDQKGGSK